MGHGGYLVPRGWVGAQVFDNPVNAVGSGDKVPIWMLETIIEKRRLMIYEKSEGLRQSRQSKEREN